MPLLAIGSPSKNNFIKAIENLNNIINKNSLIDKLNVLCSMIRKYTFFLGTYETCKEAGSIVWC